MLMGLANEFRINFYFISSVSCNFPLIDELLCLQMGKIIFLILMFYLRIMVLQLYNFVCNVQNDF